MMSAGLGACRGHAVVPTYATEKKGNKMHYEIHAAFNTTVAALIVYLPIPWTQPSPCYIPQFLSGVTYLLNYSRSNFMVPTPLPYTTTRTYRNCEICST
jgi:hypothetical protein